MKITKIILFTFLCAMTIFNSEAKKKATSILSQAQKDPANFSELVKNNSQDAATITASQGSIGLVEEGNELYASVKGYAAGKIVAKVFENETSFQVLKVVAGISVGVQWIVRIGVRKKVSAYTVPAVGTAKRFDGVILQK